MVYDGIQVNGGLNAILDKIDASRAHNTSTPKEYFSRRKAEVKKIMRFELQNQKLDCINEINQKIELINFNNKKQ